MAGNVSTALDGPGPQGVGGSVHDDATALVAVAAAGAEESVVDALPLKHDGCLDEILVKERLAVGRALGRNAGAVDEVSGEFLDAHLVRRTVDHIPHVAAARAVVGNEESKVAGPARKPCHVDLLADKGVRTLRRGGRAHCVAIVLAGRGDVVPPEHIELCVWVVHRVGPEHGPCWPGLHGDGRAQIAPGSRGHVGGGPNGNVVVVVEAAPVRSHVTAVVRRLLAEPVLHGVHVVESTLGELLDAAIVCIDDLPVDVVPRLRVVEEHTPRGSGVCPKTQNQTKDRDQHRAPTHFRSIGNG
eukprot:m.55708 g.55708  ORF g.55708 m.55708 type:complete len:300 (+) comp11984_c0_seq2:371-1270(+)